MAGPTYDEKSLRVDIPTLEPEDFFVARLASLAATARLGGSTAARPRNAAKIALAAASVALIAGGGAWASGSLPGDDRPQPPVTRPTDSTPPTVEQSHTPPTHEPSAHLGTDPSDLVPPPPATAPGTAPGTPQTGGVPTSGADDHPQDPNETDHGQGEGHGNGQGQGQGNDDDDGNGNGDNSDNDNGQDHGQGNGNDNDNDNGNGNGDNDHGQDETTTGGSTHDDGDAQESDQQQPGTGSDEEDTSDPTDD